MITTTINIDLNKFLQSILIKKQYIKKLKKQSIFLNNIEQQNYKLLNQQLVRQNKLNILGHNLVVMYIIDITFSRSNTFLHVMDSSGNLKFFCSAGYLNYKGKTKKFRFQVFKSIYRILTTKLQYLKGTPIALHLKNVGSDKSWIIRKLKKKFIIKVIKIFNLFPFNGCRQKKIVRKKSRFKKRTKRIIKKKALI